MLASLMAAFSSNVRYNVQKLIFGLLFPKGPIKTPIGFTGNLSNCDWTVKSLLYFTQAVK